MFAYLNPAGTATLPGKTLYITGVRVGESVATTVASTNSIVLTHIVAVGSTAAATSTADAAATVAPRATVIGQHGFGASDAVGTMKEGYAVDFSNGPLVVPRHIRPLHRSSLWYRHQQHTGRGRVCRVCWLSRMNQPIFEASRSTRNTTSRSSTRWRSCTLASASSPVFAVPQPSVGREQRGLLCP